MSCGKKRSLLLAISLVGCATTTTAPPPPSPMSIVREVPRATTREPRASFEGKASWYGKNHHGGPTASGERFDMNALTAAHRTLPMQTRVRCTNLRNGREVTVRINDRGPYGKCVIDLSYAAAQKLDMIDAGVVPIRCEVLR